MLYSIDYEQSPVYLDLIQVDSELKEKKRIKVILEMLSPNTMRVCTFFNNRRPLSFFEENEKPCYSIVLQRQL